MAAQRPPFTATDINALFRKVCIGGFPRIPNFYSNELSDMINSMLRQNSVSRPSVEDILNSPVVAKNCPREINLPKNPDCKLLVTIKMDNCNWKNINLPKAKYEGSSQNIEERDEYFQNFQRPRASSM